MVDITRLSFKTVLARMTKFTGLASLAALFGMGSANAFDVTVTNENGTAVSGFRWMLEEDPTFQVTPGIPTQNSLSLDFHKSYAPVIASGECDTASCAITVPDIALHYTINALPFTGHNIGAAHVSPGATSVNVLVTTDPLPTAQIRVEVFHDNSPINGAIDAPNEDNPQTDPDFDPTQFTIILEDAGGRYGATGGQITKDVYGNPLGTVYDGAANGAFPPGNVVTLGSAVMTPGADGVYTIKHIHPGKYGVLVNPPAGKGWVQTTTIEGTQVIDAWVKAKEPPLFNEFGPPGPHVWIGFVQQVNNLPAAASTGTISGTVVGNHMTRPPVVSFNPGTPIDDCWVGLSEGAGGPAIYTAPCTAGSFSIPGVPAGTYTLAVWNTALTTVIAQYSVNNVDPNWGTALDVNLGNIMVFQWFGAMENVVFADNNANGIRDAGEPGIPEMNINIRFRNGTVYLFMATDLTGAAPMEEVFPFFHWMVGEVDFSRYKATGLTYVVDAGGAIPADNGWVTPSLGVLNPQAQAAINPLTGNNLSRTIQGPVLTMGVQTFLGTTNRFEWGKIPYGQADIDNPPYGDFPGVGDIDHGTAQGDATGKLGVFDHGNGGITGVVTYSITRAENDPRFAVAEEWEPGIPRVQLALYRDLLGDGAIDDVDGTPGITYPDVDHYPLGNFPGAEDIDRNGNGVFDLGDAIQVVYTDSWDDSVPTGCVGDTYIAHPGTAIEKVTDCFDGLRNYNQVREGVFDGGYAFVSRWEIDPTDGVRKEVEGLPSGYYIVESDIPAGFQIIKEEDRNVDFGTAYQPNPLLLPPVCVGDNHVVPPYMSFQTSRVHTDLSGNPAPLAGINTADLIAAPFAGQTRKLCNRKAVVLTAGANAASDFHMFTDVSISANAVGGILNDLANEFNPASPNLGEKAAPSYLPVVFRDYTGREVLRTYSDEFGKFNARLPSTFSVNLPIPTGVSPNMLTSCMNDSAPVLNQVTGLYEKDAHYNPQFSTFCYTLMYMPGSTTYLDTPVVPVAAFAGQGEFPVDCELPDITPVIRMVDSPLGGPVVSDTSRTLTISSLGLTAVLNPDWQASMGTAAKTINRNYGFGTGRGAVKIGNKTLVVNAWSDASITVTVPAGAISGQLKVTTATGKTTEEGVWVSVLPAGVANATHVYPSTVAGATPIQNAIDAAVAGDLILVAPGVYPELVIMHKPVQLQGYGANVTTIDANNAVGTKLVDWRVRMNDMLTANAYSLLPGQTAPALTLEEGAGVTVVANVGEFVGQTSRIDGLTISSATQGGGILVNGYVNGLQISNNIVTGNQGNFGGGIRVGHPSMTFVNGAQTLHTDAQNDNISIHHNKVVKNGATNQAGGGIALYTGADNYSVTNNWICGNFAQASGAGIGVFGLSNNGTIAQNKIIFNQSFNQGTNEHGGAIALMGKLNLNAGGASDGTGAVTIEGNLIQGNQAGAGHGGGIYMDRTMTALINVVDNMIVNNVAGWAGGGIALSNAANVVIEHNTIANNDSTSTVGNTADPANLNVTLDQPGVGVVSFADTENLAGPGFSSPSLVNNIIWHNRMFHMEQSATIPATLTLRPNIGAGELPVYSDLAVSGAAGSLNPLSSLLTDATGYDVSNKTGDAAFVLGYQNGATGSTAIQGEPAALTTFNMAGAFNEGGNFVDLRFGPLNRGASNYHLGAGSVALDTASVLAANALRARDYDGNKRPTGVAADIGADEVVPDTDGDGVADDLDNCKLVANAHQYDADDDGYGNICDGDLNNIGPVVNTVDYNLFRSLYLTASPIADFNNSGGIVNSADYVIFNGLYLKPVGPSGIVP